MNFHISNLMQAFAAALCKEQRSSININTNKRVFIEDWKV